LRGVPDLRSLRCLMVALVLGSPWLLVLRIDAAQDDAGRDQGQVPDGRADVEFSLPWGEQVLVNGRDLGTQLRYTCSGLDSERLRRRPYTVQYSDDQVVEHELLLRSGWFVRIAIPSRRPRFPEMMLAPGDAAGIRSVAFSPDGRQMLIGSIDGTVALWEADRSPPLRILAGHTSAVTSVAFRSDGRQVLSGSRDKTAILWDAASGERLKTFTGNAWVVSSVALRADGRQVLTGSEDQTIRLWDAATGTRLKTFQAPAPVTSVAFSPDGRRVLSGSWDRTAILWDAASGEEVRRYRGHRGWVTSVAFRADGRQVLTGSEDKTAILWDVESGDPLHTLAGHKSGVESVTFDADGQQVLTASTDGTVILWEAAGGERLRTLSGDSASVSSVALSPDGRQVLAGSSDGYARLWDVAAGDVVGRFIALARGRDWLVSTREGLFDGSPGGRQQVRCRLGADRDSVPLERLSKLLYRPGLLALLRDSQRPLPDVDLDKSAPPEVRIVAPEPSQALTESEVTLELEVRDRGGGVSGPWLMHNGSPIADSENGQSQDGVVRRSLAVGLVPGENRFEARAANGDGTWDSESAILVLHFVER